MTADCLPIHVDIAGICWYDMGYQTKRRAQNESEIFL